MNKRIILLLFPLLIISVAVKSNEHYESLIAKISDRSITIDHSYIGTTFTYQDSTIKEIIKIGKPIANKLVSALKEPEKTLVSHMVLTKIYNENGNDFLGMKYIYKNCDDLLGWHTVYNGLIWDYYSGETTETPIEKTEINKIFAYWDEKVNHNNDSISFNTDMIFDSLKIVDSEKYPCNRVYGNTSGKIVLDSLLSLYDETYPSPKFNRLFSILGNDSSISRFKRRDGRAATFYISYRADGIVFVFNAETNKLKNIQIENLYQGKLPYYLSYYDSKEDVERKLGVPDEAGGYVDVITANYKKKNIYLQYKHNKIIHFSITGK